MESFAWTCPFCNRDTIISEESFYSESFRFPNSKSNGVLQLKIEVTACPNEKCKELTIEGFLHDVEYRPYPGNYGVMGTLNKWNLIPQSKSRVFPDYIPKQLRSDYIEACLILNLSPKASATLSRRCLQGMIRDFWGITNKHRLKDEIEEIKDKVDALVWEAIDAIRQIGNIGAHMEKDVDLIIDVDPGEAEKLIELIEMLFKEWYINRHEREQRLKHIKEIASNKRDLKVPSNS